MLIRSMMALLCVASQAVSLADNKKPKKMLTVAGFSGEEFVAKPAEINYYRQEVLLKQIGQTLVDVTPFGTYVPGLAESWAISRDRKTYTFKIRTGLKTHYGSNVTASALAGFFCKLVESKETIFSKSRFE